MNSYLLCHHCFWWVEPVAGWCPECHLPVSDEEPDPGPELMAKLLGRFDCELGRVRVPRRVLPECGRLLVTTTGLLFVPEVPEAESLRAESFPSPAALLRRMLKLVLPRAAGQTGVAEIDTAAPATAERHFESAGLRSNPPAAFLSRGCQVQTDPVVPELNLEAEPSRLLMGHPGVFFVPRQTIRSIRAASRCCWIDRVRGTSIKFIPRGDASEFRQQLRGLLSRDEWMPIPASTRM